MTIPRAVALVGQTEPCVSQELAGMSVSVGQVEPHPSQATFLVDALCRNQGRRLVKASQCDRDKIFSELRYPEDRRPAGWTEPELDRSPAVTSSCVTIRGSGNRHLFPVEEDRHSECAARASLAFPAVAGGDLDRLSLGGDRKLATGTTSFSSHWHHCVLLHMSCVAPKGAARAISTFVAAVACRVHS